MVRSVYTLPSPDSILWDFTVHVVVVVVGSLLEDQNYGNKDKTYICNLGDDLVVKAFE